VNIGSRDQCQRFSSFRIVARNSLFITRIYRKIKAPKFAYLIIKYKLKIYYTYFQNNKKQKTYKLF